jgi:hypothetical protein
MLASVHGGAAKDLRRRLGTSPPAPRAVGMRLPCRRHRSSGQRAATGGLALPLRRPSALSISSLPPSLFSSLFWPRVNGNDGRIGNDHDWRSTPGPVQAQGHVGQPTGVRHLGTHAPHGSHGRPSPFPCSLHGHGVGEIQAQDRAVHRSVLCP